MNRQILFIYIVLLFFIFFVEFNNSQCIYEDTTMNQVYNLSSLELPADRFYQVLFPGGNFIDFNLCGGAIDICGNNWIACQKTTIGSNNPIQTTDTEEITFTTTGLTIKYAAPANTCLFGTTQRTTHIQITCDLSVADLKVIGQGTENPTCTYTFSATSSLVCKKCPYNCSNHGVCDAMYTGECTCNGQTTGDGCEISLLYISSVDPTTVKGGQTTLHGFFGPITPDRLSIQIGDLSCENITVVSNETLKCDIGPSPIKGNSGSTHDVIVTVDGNLSYTAGNGFQYTPLVMRCPNDCTSPSNGNCNTTDGICTCLDKFTGFDCSSIIDTNIPPTTPTINETNGEVSFLNEDSKYQINIYSIVEFGFNGTFIQEYILENKWIPLNTSSSSSSLSSSTSPPSDNKLYEYSQTINGTNSIVQYSIEQIVNIKKDYSFAGIDFSLEPGTIKLSILIQNYTYLSNLNTIQLRIKSSIGDTSTSNECNLDDLDINTTDETSDRGQNNFNYLTITKDKKTFSGRFINRVLSDGYIGVTTTTSIIENTSDPNSIYIGLNLPHCKKSCLIDPDFSLLVNQDYQQTCRPKWFLPVVIAVPIIGFAAIVVLSALIYKKYRVNFKVLGQQLKLNKLSPNVK